MVRKYQSQESGVLDTWVVEVWYMHIYTEPTILQSSNQITITKLKNMPVKEAC